MKKYSIILIAFLSFFAISCSDYLNVNHDPNVLEEIPDAKVLLPAAEVSLANNLMGWDFGFAGAFWVQYWTQAYTASQFKFLCEYNETSFGTAYQDLTAGTLADLNRIKKITVDGDNKGTYFVAEALSIFTWQIITDLWGSIPYSEALKGDEGIDSPKFDEGKNIYVDLLKRIDELLAVDLTGSSLDAKYDFIYAGDLSQWVKFANSLKLKLTLRLSETEEYNNANLLAWVQRGNLLEKSAKISGKVWSDGEEGKRHPMREFQEGGAGYLTTNVIACRSFLDYLKVNKDPRINTLFSPASDHNHRGAFAGDFDSKADSDGNGTTDDKESYSRALFTGDMDLVLMSDWEVFFYIAEVYARAGNKEKAEENYMNGVKASLAQHGIGDHSIIESGYAKWIEGSVESEIKQISMQKWVANANYQHIESFLERNRLKYPSVNDIDIKADRKAAHENFPVGELTISVNGRAKLNGNLPQSPMYPTSILARNTNALPQKANIGEKVWWNKKVGK